MRRIPAAALLLAAAPLPAQAPAALPATMTVRAVQALPAAQPAETLRYGEAEAQVVELFLPPGPAEGAKLPVVVLVHGGCWLRSFPGRELVRPAATALAARGFAVWSIGYRRADEPGGGYPGTFLDVAAALDLLAARAGELDLGRVAFLGHSAGAHLAAWAAARHRIAGESPLASARPPFRPRGIVAAGGFLDLEGEAPFIRAACGIDPGEALAKPGAARPFADVSPAALLPSGVPITLVHGVFDGVAFPALGLAYARAARSAGDRADVIVVPVSGHFEGIAPGTAAFEQVAAALERFSR
ncbi:alpha/beta hydrolase family protein [Thermaurantiacus sp.]